MVAYPPWQKGTVEERPGGWLYTTRLAAYVEGGGGFVGVHAAACTEYDWPYYGEHGLDRRLAAERATGAVRGPQRTGRQMTEEPLAVPRLDQPVLLASFHQVGEFLGQR